MSTVKLPKTLTIHLWTSFLFLWMLGSASADVSKGSPWQILETKYTKIRYHDLKDLKKFDGKIDYSPSSLGLKGFFQKKNSDELANEIKLKVDAVYERVQEILDMRKIMKKVKINIYHDKEELHTAYQQIFNKPCRLRGWYIFEFNTIYLNVDDVHEGMLAHEIAHSIIDHYLSVRPPSATAEILARYVDGHLFD